MGQARGTGKRAWVRRLALVLVLLGGWLASGSQARAVTGVRHVIVVSVDGLRPDVLRAAAAPNVAALMGVGSWTLLARTVDPSVTLPAHCSMFSGVTPQVHGVTRNDWSPGDRVLGVPTAFSIARQHGLVCAAFVSKPKLRALVPQGVADVFEVVPRDARGVAARAAAYIEQRRPNLCFVHFSDVDSAGHSAGWGSAAQVAACGQCDSAIGLLLGAAHRAQIATESVMIVTSDHGGHGKGHGTTSAQDMTIPWVCAGRGVAMRYAIPTPVSVCDTAAVALFGLGIAPPADWTGRVVPGLFPGY